MDRTPLHDAVERMFWALVDHGDEPGAEEAAHAFADKLENPVLYQDGTQIDEELSGYLIDTPIEEDEA